MIYAILINALPILLNAAIVLCAAAFSKLLYSALVRLIRRLNRFVSPATLDEVIQKTDVPARSLLMLLMLGFAVNLANLPANWIDMINLVFRLLSVAMVGWLAAAATFAITDNLKKRYIWQGEKDNLAKRRIGTQLRVFRNVALFFITVVSIISMAMTIPGLRTLSLSLFASAGVAGLVIGMAGKSTLSNLLAGIQLALTQPIRLDDVVIVEGEWGRIEEITSTYVVVVIWDERRMVLPLSYFIEKPFQNWTHTSSDLLGTVFLYLDYTAPLEALREELDRIMDASTRWDKRVRLLQVTDAKDTTMELRILVSAGDSGTLFDLRCEVREKLIEFLKKNYPSALPRMRVEMDRKPHNMSDNAA